MRRTREWACDRLHRRGIYSAVLNTDGIQTSSTELHVERFLVINIIDVPVSSF